MPTRHATRFTNSAQRVFPLGTIARIAFLSFERPDRSTQFLFTFRQRVGHSTAIALPGHGKAACLAFRVAQARVPQSVGTGYNDVVIAPSGTGMSLLPGTLVPQGFDFDTNANLAKHRSILGRTCDRFSPVALIPSRAERSDHFIFDDAWYEASPENPYAIPKSAFMAAADSTRHDG